MPDDPAFALSVSWCSEAFNGLLNRPELLVAGDFLDRATAVGFVEREVLNDVQEGFRVQQSLDQQLLGIGR